MIKRRSARLLGDSKGAAIIEFALAAPLLILLIFGLLQIMMLLYANATVRSALGEGAREARLYRIPPSPTGWAGPTAAEICGKVASSIRSLGNADLTTLTLTRVTTPAVNGSPPANALTVDARYNVDLNFIFFSTSPTLTSSRRVYVQSRPDFGAPAHSCLA